MSQILEMIQFSARVARVVIRASVMDEVMAEAEPEVMAEVEPEVMTEEEAEVEEVVLEGEAEAETMTEGEVVASEDQVEKDEEIVNDSPKYVHYNGSGRVPNILVTSPLQGTVQNDEE